MEVFVVSDASCPITATGNRHVVMTASRQVPFHAKFGSARNRRPNASLADGSVCRVAGSVGENKELGVLVNGIFF